jgi:hypothetical protein
VMRHCLSVLAESFIGAERRGEAAGRCGKCRW